MNAPQWAQLKRIVAGIADTLATGKHSTSDQWFDLHDELMRAAELARVEAERLADEVDGHVGARSALTGRRL